MRVHLDVPLIVHSINMSWLCLVLKRNRCNDCDYFATCISLWVCLYWCMWVCVGSGARNPAVRSCMLLQSEQVNNVVMNTAGFGIG